MASKFRNEEEVATADSWLALGQGREISAPEADALCPQWLTKEVDMLDIRPCPLNRCAARMWEQGITLPREHLVD